jgi:hypothetical protein
VKLLLLGQRHIVSSLVGKQEESVKYMNPWTNCGASLVGFQFSFVLRKTLNTCKIFVADHCLFIWE